MDQDSESHTTAAAALAGNVAGPSTTNPLELQQLGPSSTSDGRSTDNAQHTVGASSSTQLKPDESTQAPQAGSTSGTNIQLKLPPAKSKANKWFLPKNPFAVQASTSATRTPISSSSSTSTLDHMVIPMEDVDNIALEVDNLKRKPLEIAKKIESTRKKLNKELEDTKKEITDEEANNNTSLGQVSNELTRLRAKKTKIERNIRELTNIETDFKNSQNNNLNDAVQYKNIQAIVTLCTGLVIAGIGIALGLVRAINSDNTGAIDVLTAVNAGTVVIAALILGYLAKLAGNDAKQVTEDANRLNEIHNAYVTALENITKLLASTLDTKGKAPISALDIQTDEAYELALQKTKVDKQFALQGIFAKLQQTLGTAPATQHITPGAAFNMLRRPN